MENNIIEGNKLILQSPFASEQQKLWLGKALVEGMSDKLYTQLQYHRSWDWLMPVVEKIIAYEFPGSSDLPFGPDTPWLRTFGKDAETGNAMVRFNRFGLHEAKTLIEATWQAVVEFINWHNQNQSNGKTGRGD